MTQREQFEAWLCREMPAGTVIGDPKWWAPRILRAAQAQAAVPDWSHPDDSQAAVEPVKDVQIVDTPVEPYAYCVYFPSEQRQEFCQDLDELGEDLTNLEDHEITKLYTSLPDHAKVMRLALEALNNSVDLVWEEYTEAERNYDNYPTRRTRLDGMKAMAQQHTDAIAALEGALK